MKPVIVVTEGLEDVPLTWLRSHAVTREVSHKDTAGLERALADANGLIVRTYTQVNDALLSQGPKLRVVGRAGVGLENIDSGACAKRHIQVISTPTANTRAVCEYVYNLIFHLGRPLVNLTAPVSPEEFHRYRKEIRGLELHGKTMGILGMGRIGRGVGRIARAMGMRVLYNDVIDVHEQVDFDAQSVEKPILWSQADILTIHVSHRPGNTNLINDYVLAALKPTAYLINTSRGEVIDSAALAAALRAGKLAGAAIDVHEPEPPPPDYPLWNCPNLIFAPHLAARTQGAMDAMSWVARDVVEFLLTQAV